MEHPSKVLKRYNLSPIKRLSQHFLTNIHSIEGAEKLFEPDDVILEIGSGLGAVTDYLLLHNFSVVLCEKDRELANFLKRKYQNQQEIIDRDFLDVPIDYWCEKKVTACVSNLPFHITTEIILKIVKKMTFVKSCLWGLQKEVAERLCIEKKSSSLSIFLKMCGNIRLISLIKKNSFYPKPNIDACWVFWERSLKVQESELFEVLLRSAFWGKRKTIMNALKRSPHLQIPTTQHWLNKIKFPSSDIEKLLQKRADNLQLEDYLLLFEWLQN